MKCALDLVFKLSLCAATALCAYDLQQLKHSRSHEHQARQWLVTLDQSHRVSGQPWRAEISATSYERARATARERLNWSNDSFSVSPVVENYLDIRRMELVP